MNWIQKQALSWRMKMNQIEQEVPDKSVDGTPVCIRCFKPVDPYSPLLLSLRRGNRAVHPLYPVCQYPLADAHLGSGLATDMVT